MYSSHTCLYTWMYTCMRAQSGHVQALLKLFRGLLIFFSLHCRVILIVFHNIIRNQIDNQLIQNPDGKGTIHPVYIRPRIYVFHCALSQARTIAVESTMMYLKMAELGLAQRAPFRTDSRAPPTGEQCQTTTTTLCTYAPRSTRLDISLKKNTTTLKFDLDLPVAVF